MINTGLETPIPPPDSRRRELSTLADPLWITTRPIFGKTRSDRSRALRYKVLIVAFFLCLSRIYYKKYKKDTDFVRTRKDQAFNRQENKTMQENRTMKQTTNSLLFTLLTENSATTEAAQAALQELKRRGVSRVRVTDDIDGRYYVAPECLPHMGNKAKRECEDLAPVFRK